MKTLDQIRKELPAARRKKIAARAAKIIAEEMTLQELRKAHQKTQTQVAKTLGMTQDEVSRLERRSDVLLSTLRRFVEGMGGRLSLIAEFPNNAPIALSGFAVDAAGLSQQSAVGSRTPRSRGRKPTFSTKL